MITSCIRSPTSTQDQQSNIVQVTRAEALTLVLRWRRLPIPALTIPSWRAIPTLRLTVASVTVAATVAAPVAGVLVDVVGAVATPAPWWRGWARVRRPSTGRTVRTGRKRVPTRRRVVGLERERGHHVVLIN